MAAIGAGRVCDLGPPQGFLSWLIWVWVKTRYPTFTRGNSLPEFMNFKLFGKTICVVNIEFELFVGHPLSQ